MMYLLQDFEAIGIDKRGFRLRILKAAAKLPSFSIHVDVPVRENLRNFPGIIISRYKRVIKVIQSLQYYITRSVKSE